MAQRNISWRLSRSLNAYLRCKFFRYDPFPVTFRQYHERDGDNGSDDTIKKRTQDKDKVKGSSNETTLRVNRCRSVKSVSEDTTGNRTFDSVAGNCTTERTSKKYLKKPKVIQKLDLSRFEKACEENGQYIRNILNDTSDKPGSTDPSVSKNENTLLHAPGLKIPSHEEVQQQSLLNKGLKIPQHIRDIEQEIDSHSYYKPTASTLDNNPSSSNDQYSESKLNSSILSTDNEVMASFENKSLDSPKQTFYAKRSDSNRAETIKRYNNQSTAITSGGTDNPYVFPTHTDNSGYKRKFSEDQTEIQPSNDKSKRISDEDIDFDITDSFSELKTSDRIYASSKRESKNYEINRTRDIKMDSRLSPFKLSKLNEKSEYIETPSNSVDHKAPLRGTVSVLLKANSKIRMQQDTKIIGRDTKSDKSHPGGENVANKVNQSNNVNETSKVEQIIPNDESNLLMSMKPNSADIEKDFNDTAKLEEEFERTIGSQKPSKMCSKNSENKVTVFDNPSDLNSVDPVLIVKKNDEQQKESENYNFTSYEKYNPVDAIFEVKSEASKLYFTSDKGTVNSESKNIIKSKDDIIPGDLYQSNSECIANENRLESENLKFKGVQFQAETRNKTADFIGKRLKSKGVKKASKQKSKSTIGHKTDFSKLGNQKASNNKQYDLDAKAESNLTPNDLYNSKSEGENEIIYEREYTRTGPKKDMRKNKLKNENVEYDSEKSNDLDLKPYNVDESGKFSSEDNLSKVQRSSTVPRSRSRDPQKEEENLKHAKLYISKAKRLRDKAKKKSLERKNRLRSGKGTKTKQRRPTKPKNSKAELSISKQSKEKMSMSDFLYGLISNKNKNKKGGGDQRSYITYSSQNWPIKRRKVHRHNSDSIKNLWNPKNSDVFISPDVSKQGLGADAIKKDRKNKEHKEEWSESKSIDNTKKR